MLLSFLNFSFSRLIYFESRFPGDGRLSQKKKKPTTTKKTESASCAFPDNPRSRLFMKNDSTVFNDNNKNRVQLGIVNPIKMSAP